MYGLGKSGTIVAFAILVLVLTIALAVAIGFSCSKLTQFIRELRRGNQSAVQIDFRVKLFPPTREGGAAPARQSLPPDTKAS
jgi:hypothetical protein